MSYQIFQQAALLMKLAHSFIHSSSRPSYDRSKANPPQSVIQCFLFQVQHLIFSLRPFSSCLHLRRHLHVTYILPYIVPSIIYSSTQFLFKLWPIQSAFLPFTVRTFFPSSFTLCKTSLFLTRSTQPIFSNLLQHHIPNLSKYFWFAFRNVQFSAPHYAVLQM